MVTTRNSTATATTTTTRASTPTTRSADHSRRAIASTPYGLLAEHFAHHGGGGLLAFSALPDAPVQPATPARRPIGSRAAAVGKRLQSALASSRRQTECSPS